MQRRVVRGIVVAGIGGVATLTLMTSGEAQVPPTPTFTIPSVPNPPTMPPFPTTQPPPTMPPPTVSTTTPPPTMPPPTTTPPPTMPPPTRPPVTISSNLERLIREVVDQLEGFGDAYDEAIDELLDIIGEG